MNGEKKEDIFKKIDYVFTIINEQNGGGRKKRIGYKSCIQCELIISIGDNMLCKECFGL